MSLTEIKVLSYIYWAGLGVKLSFGNQAVVLFIYALCFKEELIMESRISGRINNA